MDLAPMGMVLLFVSMLVQLVCTILIMVEVSRIHGWFWALMGFFFCQIGLLFWSIRSGEKSYLGILWIFAILGGMAGIMMMGGRRYGG